jgi:hypothetical protein
MNERIMYHKWQPFGLYTTKNYPKRKTNPRKPHRCLQEQTLEKGPKLEGGGGVFMKVKIQIVFS